MKKYNYIDFMKTMAMFLVIVAHCALFFSGNEFWFIKAEQESILLRWVSKFVVLSVVPIFTFASGFLLMMFWVTVIWILLNGLLRKANLIYGAVVSVVLYFAVHFFLGQIDYYKISQIDIYIIVFFVGAAFFYVSDVVYNNVSKWVLIVGSLVGIIACVFLAQLSTQIYIIECVLKIVIPVLFLTLSMGLCRIKEVRKLEETGVYNWLCKNSLYIYLLQAPGVYIVFGIIYPLIGSSPLLCFLVVFILTTLLDVILTLIYVFFKEKISRIKETAQ